MDKENLNFMFETHRRRDVLFLTHVSSPQIITALEEDTTAQKMQLGYRLQQIAAAVENKVTDL